MISNAAILEIEEKMLSTICRNSNSEALKNGILDSREQLAYIREQLEILGLSFATMIKAGSSYGFGAYNEMTKDVVESFQVTVEHLVRGVLDGKMAEEEMDEFLCDFTLGAKPEDSHLSLCFQNDEEIINFKSLHTVLDFYTIAEIIDDRRKTFQIDGKIITDPSKEEIDDILLSLIRGRAMNLSYMLKSSSRGSTQSFRMLG
jgi:hypothetical protein